MKPLLVTYSLCIIFFSCPIVGQEFKVLTKSDLNSPIYAINDRNLKQQYSQQPIHQNKMNLRKKELEEIFHNKCAVLLIKNQP